MLTQCVNNQGLIWPNLYHFYKAHKVSDNVVRITSLGNRPYTFNKLRRFK
jgi:hypothetical protein